MRIARVVSLTTLAAVAHSQIGSGTFEPQDFNVTAALEDLGVAVEALPEPGNATASLAERSLFAQCSLAVSFYCSKLQPNGTNRCPVHILEDSVW